MRRFRRMTTETAGFYNTVGFNDDRRIDVTFIGQRAGTRAQVRFVDQERGSPMPAWRRVGAPQYPTEAPIAELCRVADIALPTLVRLAPEAHCRWNCRPRAWR
jgi:hypothetical protein